MPFRSILPLALLSAMTLLPHSGFPTTPTFYTNEPRCCHAATSERRRIRLKADYYYIALRGASIRRSQRGNSEAVFFRGTLPRRYSIRRSQRSNSEAICARNEATMPPPTRFYSLLPYKNICVSKDFVPEYVTFLVHFDHNVFVFFATFELSKRIHRRRVKGFAHHVDFRHA